MTIDPLVLVGLLVGQLLLALIVASIVALLPPGPPQERRMARLRQQGAAWGTGDTRTLPTAAEAPPATATTHNGHGPSRRWWLVSRFADGGKWWVVYESRIPNQAEPEHMTLEVPAPGTPGWP